MSAESSVFKRKDGKWCAKYKDASGKWKYLYRKNKGEAKAALREALKDREKGITPTDLTVNDALESWLRDTQHTVSSRTWLRVCANRRVANVSIGYEAAVQSLREPPTAKSS